MIRVQVFDTSIGRRGKWVEIPNGPFPITRAALTEARRLYKVEWDRTEPLCGVRVSPQTTARALLKQVTPHLSDFDAGMLGFAVSNDHIRVEEEINGQ